jgi:CheY-like chemotaxis protein
MSIVSIFGGNFCFRQEVVERVADQTGYQVVRDEDVIGPAAQASGMDEAKLARAMTSSRSLFSRFTHEKERSIAWLRLAAAQRLKDDGLLFMGFTGLLIPPSVSHVLKVCLIADIQSRVRHAHELHGLSEKEALKQIRAHDEDCAAWIENISRHKDPWSASQYDIVLPMHQTSVEKAVELILANLEKPVLATTAASRSAVDDLILASRVEVRLAEAGHNVGVAARDGRITITINKNVMLLSRLEEDLAGHTRQVDGVKDVEFKVGPDFYQTDIYRKANFDMPSKVLLVDDEREFVQSLSERLQMREMGSHVVYDGESALETIGQEEPDVMILDLKMPGIDGIEVLRRVKAKNPKIEVIILTGHGSDEDRQVCLDLGAFAYLRKPFDIEALTEVLKAANEKVRAHSDRN